MFKLDMARDTAVDILRCNVYKRYKVTTKEGTRFYRGGILSQIYDALPRKAKKEIIKQLKK